MSDTTHYALSQDYELMFVLLENGPLLGFVDYEQGSTLRDPVQIKRDDAEYFGFEYRAGVRGLGYLNAWGKNAKDMFIEKCLKYNLSFIVPNADAEARAEQSEANVARLTKMVDWLANQLDCPSEFTNCAVDCAECRKEAASRAVAAGEG